MLAMKSVLGLLVLMAVTISRVKATCVLNSDFGFTLDCAFKKSGLFRVRNLGGLKAHVGLGFSVGDELGFGQSLTNLDTSKRRSVSSREGVVATANGIGGAMQQPKQKVAPKRNKNRLVVRMPSSTTISPVISTSSTEKTMIAVEDNVIPSGRSLQSSVRHLSPNKAAPISIPPFKPIPPAQDMQLPLPTSPTHTHSKKVFVPSQSIPSNTQQQNQNLNRIGQVPKSNFVSVSAAPVRISNVAQNNLVSVGQQIGVSNVADQAFRAIPAPVMTGVSPQYASYQVMPTSRITNYQSPNNEDSTKLHGSVSVVSPQTYRNTVQLPLNPSLSKVPTAASYSPNTISIRKSDDQTQYQQNNFVPQQSQFSYNQLPNFMAKPVQKVDNMVSYNSISNQNNFLQEGTLSEKITAISKATNISVEAIEAAIKLRQQQLVNQMLNAPPRTTSTTTRRPPPPPPKRHNKPQEPTQKVMNAPKEYYPVGYDKNFDDNFVSKVELPETSFYCGDQKHFPGLYADEDLGCMVFHVCALTDEGLIMKSFLCPESTLFDQTILKCNWWFYVDCKSSKRLYDSNIPISKSYQLMKALTFFSSYKKDVQSNDQNSVNQLNQQSVITENKEGVKNAVKILQTQSQMELPKVEIIEVKSRRNATWASRNSKIFTPVNINEINSLSTPVSEIENKAEEKVETANTNTNRFRPIPNRHASTNLKENASKYVRAASKVKKESSPPAIQVTTSTEKSVEKSTSVERKSTRRRPVLPTTTPVQNETKTSDSNHNNTNELSRQKHRSERASEETYEKTNKNDKSKKPEISIQEKSSNSQAHNIVTPKNRHMVEATIAKMDEAIIGHKKPDST